MDIYLIIAFFTSSILGGVWIITLVQLFILSDAQDLKKMSGYKNQVYTFFSAFFNIFGVRSSLSTFKPIKAQIHKMRWVLVMFLLSFGVAIIGVINMLTA
ncbi:hypothetical protein V6255_13800 [Psychromonas arctica]|uniref:Uncharacterized protein n=1 Tax=Psychromonas arctica TaxID=168275 RepID=A0ABU9HE73_9GAMM